MLVENLTDLTEPSVETPIVESESSESIPDQGQQVEMVVDPVFSSKGPPFDDTFSKENENDTVQIPFVNTKSDEHGDNLPVALP